ncbi:MAG: hypothetical protein IJP92_12525 [Lachnospiraceae bacterium]|nr:hypothetical protein [Lachnospiraceae bacterium]
MRDKPMVQAAVDVEDLEQGLAVARMAADCGAEWIEIGTPLLFRYGYEVIAAFRDAVGDRAKLIADYKFPYGMLVMDDVARHGADYVLVGAGYQEQLILDTVQKGGELGIVPVFHLGVHPRDYTRYARIYADMGAKYFFTHHYYEARNAQDDSVTRYDNLKNLRACGDDIRIIVTNDDFEDAVFCAAEGADMICFGAVLRGPESSPGVCRKWVEAIHGARG